MNNSASAKTITIERNLVKIQAVAGCAFFIFLILHITNTLMAPFGADAYNGYQRAVSVFYQHPLVESLLVLLPVTSHAIAGIWLHTIRRSRKMRRTAEKTLHRWAGIFMLLTVFSHIAATRGISYFNNIDTEFSGVAFSLWWMPAYFYPYYFLLFMAGLYHGSNGFMSVLNRRKTHSQEKHIIPNSFWLAAATTIVMALLSFGGKLYPIDDPRNNDYARTYADLMSIDLTQEWKP